MNNINITIGELKNILDKIPDEDNNMPVIVPIVDEENANNILAFRHVRTVGILHEDGEIADGYALSLNPAANGYDIAAQIDEHNNHELTCVRVLF